MKKHKCTKVCYDDGYEEGRTSAINDIMKEIDTSEYILCKEYFERDKSVPLSCLDHISQESILCQFSKLKQKIQALKSPQVNSDISLNKTSAFLNKPEDTFISLNQVREIFEEIHEKMWHHPKGFIGIKCKTCLPLDYIDDIILEQLNKLGEKSR